MRGSDPGSRDRALHLKAWAAVALVVTGLLPASPASAERIAYVRVGDDDNAQLRIVRSDGERDRAVTWLRDICKMDGCDSDPTWSHDRKRIAFSDQHRIWTVRPNGEDREALTRPTEWGDEEPSWAPGDDRLVIEREPDESVEVWIYSADGRQLRQVDRSAIAHDPMWSPVSQQIVYARYGSIAKTRPSRTGGTTLFQTKNPREKRRAPRSASDPVWAPNGRSIAFVVDHSLRNYDSGTKRSGRCDATVAPRRVSPKRSTIWMTVTPCGLPMGSGSRS